MLHELLEDIKKALSYTIFCIEFIFSHQIELFKIYTHKVQFPGYLVQLFCHTQHHNVYVQLC